MHNRTISALTTAAAVMALAACGAGDDPPEALPLTAHVVPADGLEGFARNGAVVRQDAAAFAEEHEQTPAQVEQTGLVAGATAQFTGGSSGSAQATSVAVELGSDAAAAKEAERLYRSNSEPDPGVTARALDVPGIPGARAVELSGKEDGQPFTGVEVVFADGSVVHEVFAFGPATEISAPPVLAAARALYDRIKGHPLPAA